MATGAAPSSAHVTDASRAYEQTIDNHLNRTRWQVKLIELGASSVLLLVGILGFFLVISLVDHWVLPIGGVARGLLLAALLTSVCYYIWRQLLPLLVRSINPEYAAHAIEESTPTLKNSLLNFLLLRRSPTGVKEVVLEALQKRAAADISAVPLDAAVDRSKLIRMGYLLVGVMAILGVYKILSPKDPFQTAARVLAPWADIARPSRVQISDVHPGTTEVYLGESVKVSAAVAGARENDAVTLFYSTADGTSINQSLKMTAAAGGRFEATLPAGGEAGQISSSGGLQQNAVYRIEAGDAVSAEYDLRVIESPRIVVEKAEYSFPAYTRKAPQSTTSGDLKGLEGTRITIHARANQPIKSAWIEFDPQPDAGPVETVKLETNGDRASGSIVLQLRPDRRSAWRGTFQVRFINDRQQQSQQPILHRIEVLRDLPPEVEIITPEAREIEVPENGMQPIEVRAVDPDFGISSLKLMGSARGKEIVIRSLLDPAEGQPPQMLKRFEFRPQQWKWKAGDVLTYWATVEDNRTAVPSANAQGAAIPPAAEPNSAKTELYTIRVVAAKEGKGNNAKGDRGQQDNNADPNADNAGEQGSPMNGGQDGGAKNADNQSAAGEKKSKQGEGSSEEQQGGNKSGEKNQSSSGGQQQKNGSESGEGQSEKSDQGGGSSSSGESGSSGSEDSGDASEGSQGGGGSGKQGSGNQGTKSGEQQGDESSGEGQAGQGGAGGTSKSGKQNQSGGEPGERTGESGGEPGSRGEQRGGAGSKKPEHDGEVFDKLLDEMQQDEGGQESGEQSSGGQNGSGQQQTGEQPGEGQQSGEQKGGGQKGGGQKGTGQKGTGQQGAGESADEGQAGEPNAQPNGNPMNGNESGAPMGDKPENQAGGANQPRPGGGNAGVKDPGEQRADGQEGAAGSESAGQEKAGQAPGKAGSPKAGKAGGGKAGSKGGEKTPNNQPQPDGSDGSPKGDDAEKGAGEKGALEKGSEKPMQGDDAQGKGPNEQNAPGEGGRPQGAARTDERDPKNDKQGSGEPKEAGAGQNGDSGAGKNSTDKTGSGQGQETNRDRQKDMSDSNSKAESGETSSPSNSKRQSDSKGGTSGDRSGGGSKGAGQSGGQEGNDTAGSHSAADEGAGAANETGMGETGSKGGQGEKSDEKTGSAGDEKGEGSSTRPGEKGTEKGTAPKTDANEKSQPSPKNDQGERGPQADQGEATGDKPEGNDPATSGGQKSAGGTGPVVGGGQQGDRPKGDYGPDGPATEADEANLEFAKKATDLVLSKLKEHEHDPDPELLDRLGMSREQMQEFVRRWEGLKAEADRDPKAARELNEALRSLGLKDPKQRKRTGGTVSDNQRELRDSGTRVAPPSKYRDQFDAFRKGATRSGNR
jgi:hypothetical protein